MKTLKLWRTFDESIRNFRRNGWLTFATIAILSLSLFIIGFSASAAFTTDRVLTALKNRVTLMVSFNPDVSEDRILEIKGELERFTQEIQSIEYISRDQALADFETQYKDDPSVRRALDEIGGNPLPASLVIRAQRSEQYELISKEIKESTFQNDILRVSYDRHKRVFERLNHINEATRTTGVALIAVFVGIALIITFYTFYITIHSHKQEFEVMRLVGASNLYMRMPFFFESIFYSLIASILATVFLGVASKALTPFLAGALPNGTLFSLFLSSSWILFLGLFLLGIAISSISSFLAMRKYLKI